jgi:hypothetical protein
MSPLLTKRPAKNGPLNLMFIDQSIAQGMSPGNSGPDAENTANGLPEHC